MTRRVSRAWPGPCLPSPDRACLATIAGSDAASSPRLFKLHRDGELLAVGAYVQEDAGAVVWPTDQPICVVFPSLAHVEPFYAVGGLVTLELVDG